MERASAQHEITPEQAAAAILQAVNLEQDRYDWECELQRYRHISGVAHGSRQFWPDQCLRLDAFWSSLGTSVGITRSITQWPAHDGFLLYTETELSVRVGTIRSAADASYLLQAMWTWSLASAPSTTRPELAAALGGALTLGPSASSTTYIPIETLVTYTG